MCLRILWAGKSQLRLGRQAEHKHACGGSAMWICDLHNHVMLISPHCFAEIQDISRTLPAASTAFTAVQCHHLTYKSIKINFIIYL